MNIDLNEYRFKQADLLQLVPGLNQGMWQNWLARGIFEGERPHKHAKALLSGINIIAVRFMIEVGKFGIKPSEAIDLADDFVQEIDGFMKRFKPTLNEETGAEEYAVEGDRLQDYQRMEIIRRDGGKLVIVPVSSDAAQRNFSNAMMHQRLVSVTVESDLLFLVSLNGIARHLAGRDRQAGKTLLGKKGRSDV